MCELAPPSLQDISPNPCNEVEEAERSLLKALGAAGAPLDEELTVFFSKYCERKHEQKLFELSDEEFYQRLLYLDSAHHVGAKITDLLMLLQIIAPQTENHLWVVDEFRHFLNHRLLEVSPGLSLLHASTLMSRYNGEGIKIAIFDVFDPFLLKIQRVHYNKSHISSVKKFGDPVQLSHGNSVIDIVLSIAPNAELILVSSDSFSMTNAVNFLREQSDIPIVNMSRALKADAKGRLDRGFATQMVALAKEKIVVKALGNSGSDLVGQTTPARRALNLGPTGDFSSYDSAQIAELLETLSNDKLILAQSWSLDGKEISLSATTAGENKRALDRIACVPAEAAFSWSTDNFESGSSFAAPQIAAVAALLVEAQHKLRGTTELATVATLLRSPHRIINGNDALKKL